MADASIPPPGTHVRLRGASWSVVRHTRYDDCVALRLEAGKGRGARTFLLPFDRVRAVEGRRATRVSPRAWLHALREALARTYPLGGLRCPAARIHLVTYQLEPAVAMLRHGYSRLLVAHDVGTGKTIEAGIVLRELAARRDGLRALILAPAGLRQQWRAELFGKFAIEATIADAAWLRDAERVLPPEINPWAAPGTYIASFDFVKRPEALRGLEMERWDLVVVDEAHTCSTATDRRLAADAIAGRALRVLLLTATPPATAGELEALCALGAGAGPPAAVLRCHRPSPRAGARRSVLLPVRLGERERRMHRLLARYTGLLWQGTDTAAPRRLLGIVLRKRALSSAQSLARSVQRRQELLAGRAAAASLHQLLLPLEGLHEDPLDDCVGDGLLAADGLADPDHERRWLVRLAEEAAAAAEHEAKAHALVRLLRRLREPVIVFTEYRDTLERLHRLLGDAAVACCLLHGGLAPEQRRTALSTFARGGHVLLATDTAAEGLNLHHRCRIVVHHELPWNPARLLQRAGRVDRFGQERRVHEIALVARDTAESLVLAPLARRALRSEEAGGGARMIELLSESRVAAMVFDGQEPPAAAAHPRKVAILDVSSEASEERRRLHGLRRLAPAAHEGVAHRPRVPVTIVRLQSLAPGFVLLFELTFTSVEGDIEERDLAVIHVRTGRSFGLDGFRRRLNELLPPLSKAVAPTVDALLQERVRQLQPTFEAARGRLGDRERELRAIDASAARAIVQRGLFERSVRTASHLFAAGREGDRGPRDRSRVGAAVLSSSAELLAVLVAVHR